MIKNNFVISESDYINNNDKLVIFYFSCNMYAHVHNVLVFI